MLHRVRRARPSLLGPLVAALLATSALAGCTVDAPAGDDGDDGTTVALLLADDTRPRWQARDVPVLEQRLARSCPECRLVTYVADGDPGLQARQLRESLDAGADAVVLQATSPQAGAELVDGAGEVPVVAYDRAAAGATHAVTGDGAELGRLQGRAVVDALGAGARGAGVLLLEAAVADAAEQGRRAAVRRVLRAAGARVLAAPEPTDGTADEARAATAAQLVRRGAVVAAVVAATDVQAGGAVAALQGLAPGGEVPVVGADADLDAVRRLVTGSQAATVWTDERALAARAAEVAAALARGQDVPAQAGTTSVDAVPTDVVGPVAVERDDVAQVLVRRGVVTIEKLCDAAARSACRSAGLV